TYAEVEERSRRLARGLLADGVGKGTRVGILMPNGVDWVVTWLAAARIGALVVPINTFFRARELAHVLVHADVERLLVRPQFLKHDYVERLEQAAPGLARADARDARGASVPLRLASVPFLRRVRVFGEAERRWALPGEEALGALAEQSGVGDDLLRAAEQ